MLRQFIIMVALFAALGVPVSKEILAIFGLESNLAAVALGGLLLAIMLVFRNVFLLFLVLLLTIAINLPDQVLFSYGIDKVVLMGVLFAMVLFPTIHKMMAS